MTRIIRSGVMNNLEAAEKETDALKKQLEEHAKTPRRLGLPINKDDNHGNLWKIFMPNILIIETRKD